MIEGMIDDNFFRMTIDVKICTITVMIIVDLTNTSTGDYPAWATMCFGTYIVSVINLRIPHLYWFL